MLISTPSKRTRINKWVKLVGWGSIITILICLAWYGLLPGISASSIQTPSRKVVAWLAKPILPEAEYQKLAAVPFEPQVLPLSLVTPEMLLTPATQSPGISNQPELATVVTMTPTMNSSTNLYQADNETASSAVAGLNPEAVELKALIQDLISRMQVTLMGIENSGGRQPTAAEVSAIRSQVTDFAFQIGEIQDRFELLQAGKLDETALLQPQLVVTPVPNQTQPAVNSSLEQYSKLQAQMLEMQRVLAAMAGYQGVSPTEPSIGATRIFPTSTPVASLTATATADPHNHSSPPDTAGSGAAGDPNPSGSGMSMMPCMGDQNSQSSGASPVVANGPLAKTVATSSFSLTAVPLTIHGSADTTIDFYIVLDSSDGELRPDLARTIKLRLPDGRDVPVSAWTGPISGSHIEGTLSFSREDTTGLALSIPYEGNLSLDIGPLTRVNGQVIFWDLSILP